MYNQAGPLTSFMLPLAHVWLDLDVLIKTEATYSPMHEHKGQMSESINIWKDFSSGYPDEQLPMVLFVAKDTGADTLLSGTLTMRCLHCLQLNLVVRSIHCIKFCFNAVFS